MIETGEPQDKADFNVATASIPQGTEEIDLKSKTALEILEKVKKGTKDPISEEEDPVLKYIEKAMKYLPIIMEAFKGFNMASQNFQASRQPQRPSIQPPDGWESMSPIQRLGRKYSAPDWYEAGERWESYKETGQISQINTGYVDPTYNQAVAQRQQAQNLRDLQQRHPEPPLIKQNEPQQERPPEQEPDFIEKAKQKQGIETGQDKPQGEETTMIINALREDNNKYVEMAFNYLAGLEMEQFKEYVKNIDKLKPKFSMLNMLLPFQTKEMIKNTSSEEFVSIFKEKSPDKYKWLQEEKKVPQLKKLFEELKEML